MESASKKNRFVFRSGLKSGSRKKGVEVPRKRAGKGRNRPEDIELHRSTSSVFRVRHVNIQVNTFSEGGSRV